MEVCEAGVLEVNILEEFLWISLKFNVLFSSLRLLSPRNRLFKRHRFIYGESEREKLFGQEETNVLTFTLFVTLCLVWFIFMKLKSLFE